MRLGPGRFKEADEEGKSTIVFPWRRGLSLLGALSPGQPTSASGPLPGPPLLRRIRLRNVSTHEETRATPFTGTTRSLRSVAAVACPAWPLRSGLQAGVAAPHRPPGLPRLLLAVALRPGKGSLGAAAGGPSCPLDSAAARNPSRFPLRAFLPRSLPLPNLERKFPACGTCCCPRSPTSAACVPRPPPQVVHGVSSCPSSRLGISVGPSPFLGAPCSLEAPPLVDEPPGLT